MQSFLVKVKKENHDFTERELKILYVLLLNDVAAGYVKVVNKNMYINPVESDEKDLLLHEQFVIEEEVETALFDDIKAFVERKVNGSLKRSGISDVYVEVQLEY